MTEYKEDYTYVTTQEGLDEAVKWCRDYSYIVFDIETGPSDKYIGNKQEEATAGLDPHKGKIYTMQLGNRFKQFIIDLRAPLDLTGVGELLEDPNMGILGVNLRFDVKFVMHHYGWIPNRLLDCMIMEQIIRSGLFTIDSSEKKSMVVRKHTGMKSLAKRYLDVDIDKDKDLRIGLWKTQMGLFDNRQLSYMAGDCIYPDLIAREQKPLIIERELGNVIQLEHELIPVVANMELVGIPFNKPYWISLLQEAYDEEKEYELKLDGFFNQKIVSQEDLFGESSVQRQYDYSSTKQLAQALTNAGIQGFRSDTSTSSDKIKLMKVAGKIDSDLADNIIGYRKAKKKVESYGGNIISSVHNVTGRIHPNFTQTCLVTGRMSCSPGMQTIPKEDVYRKAFNSPNGYTLVVLDASQIEARIAADLTNDEPAIKVFNEGRDIYKEDGQLMFQREIVRHTPEGEKLRSRAKAAWLGLTYGQGKAKFNRYCRLFLGEDIPKKDTDFLYDKFFEIHYNMKEVMNAWSASADPLNSNSYYRDIVARDFIDPLKAYDVLLSIYKDRVTEERAIQIVERLLADKERVTYTATKLGRKRFYRRDFVGWWTAARNHPIQGCAADIQKATMIAFQQYHWNHGFDANIINVVHDEVITLVREDQAEDLYKAQILLGEEVGQRFLTKVPMKLEGGISRVWKKEF